MTKRTSDSRFTFACDGLKLSDALKRWQKAISRSLTAKEANNRHDRRSADAAVLYHAKRVCKMTGVLLILDHNDDITDEELVHIEDFILWAASPPAQRPSFVAVEPGQVIAHSLK